MRTLVVLAVLVVIIAFAAGALLLRPGGERSSTSSARSTGGQPDSSTPTVTTDVQAAAVFDGNTTTLLLPKGYRQWVFVGSSLGLQYSASPSDIFNHVYIDPVAYREYSSTGTFPEGTVMILELLSREDKHEPDLSGTIGVKFVGLQASVKDSSKFPEGWAYYRFDHPDAPDAKATPFSPVSCWKCHHEKAATDHVFTQFYPVLRAAHAQ